jgi:hypothetical protein
MLGFQKLPCLIIMPAVHVVQPQVIVKYDTSPMSQCTSWHSLHFLHECVPEGVQIQEGMEQYLAGMFQFHHLGNCTFLQLELVRQDIQRFLVY